MFLPSYNGTAFGLNAIYSGKPGAPLTWYLNGHAYYDSYSAYYEARNTHDEITGARINTAIGLKTSTLLDRFFFMFGIGPELRLYSVQEKDASNFNTQTQARTTKVLPFLEAKLGVEF